jgi:hypothetical protein
MFLLKQFTWSGAPAVSLSIAAIIGTMGGIAPADAQESPSFLNPAQQVADNTFLSPVTAPISAETAAAEAMAAAANSAPQAVQMTPSYTTYATGEGPQGESHIASALTSKQNGAGMNLARAGAAILSSHGGGLPPTSMDSFVQQAGGMADLIYGDEGTDGLPPYYEFDQTHRINAGIFGVDNAGLTTNHGSVLPNAWGGDEFVKTEPWTMSGAQGFAFDLGGIVLSVGP